MQQFSAHARAFSVACMIFLLFGTKVAGFTAGPVTGRDAELDSDKYFLQKFLEGALPASSQKYNFSAPVCSWYGVLCSESGNRTRMKRLLLESLSLRGTIPNGTLGQLSALSQLSLHNNSLKGFISEELWNLGDLKYLSLSMNEFAEPVSRKLANLTKLERLDLSHNKLNGSIPPEVGQSVNLRYLYLNSNSLSGNLSPDIFGSPSLFVVDLSSNNLAGSLPMDVANMPHLVSLNLSRNLLTGKLPLQLLNSHLLSVLDLSKNSFTGSVSIPTGSRFSRVQVLDLSSNKLTGDLPRNFSSFSSLRHLSLSDNSFTAGGFPALDGATGLQFLNVSFTHLEGVIPDSLGKLSNLTVLDLSHNSLRGNVPLSFSNLVSLTLLDLSNNALGGNISHLSNLPSLLHLNLSYNSFLGCNAALLQKFGSDSFRGLSCQPSAADVSLIRKLPPVRFRLRLALLIGIVSGFVVVLCLILISAALLFRRRGEWPVQKVWTSRDDRYLSGPFSFESKSGPWAVDVKNPSSVPVVMFEKPLLTLTFADLLRATSNFNKETQVSQGGLGAVYSAVLPGGMHVSVKVLIEGRILTNQEATAEFAMLAKIKHPNLVPLLGYCVVGEERLVIYEFMKNGGLHRWLRGSPENGDTSTLCLQYDVSMDLAKRTEIEPLPKSAILRWELRHKVALGIARALAFLHHGQSNQIVHRDVKASNVMLDEEFEPHLANTGLAGLLAGSNDAVLAGGGPGYAPPEYCCSKGEVTTCGDVFSYGVVLLELVTGKRPVGDCYDHDCGVATDLVSWVRMLMHEKRGIAMALDLSVCVDQTSQEQMLEVLRIGYLCTAEAPSKRPTIQQVVGLLKDMQPDIASQL